MSEKARLFLLTWDNSKLPVKNPDDRYGKIETEGAHFANGAVAIAHPVCVWESMTDMKLHFQWHGNCSITWEDGQIEEIKPASNSVSPWRKRYSAAH